MDTQTRADQTRYLADTYVPIKGQGITTTNQQVSNLSNVLNMDKARVSGANSEVVRSIKPKNLRD
jgi:hypothetical protein